MKGRILLLGGNYHPELTGIGKYNGEMINWLSANGCDCGVVTTYPYYPFWKVQAPYKIHSFWFKIEEKCSVTGKPIRIYRCPHYVPKVPNGKKRVLSDLTFFISVFIQVFFLLFGKKYDYVLTVAPPFNIGLIGYLYKIIKGAKLIYHVQDLQIDAAAELGMIKSKQLLNAMLKAECFLLKKSDYVSSISEGMVSRIKLKYNREVLLFPNWTNTHRYYPLPDKAGLKEQYNFSGRDKVVVYSGAIGEKQGLHMLLEVAGELQQRKEIKFVICGLGPYKQNLVQMAEEMHLQNVFFLPLQPEDKFNQFLNMADVHLVLQKAKANDLVMPSKLTNILSVGGLALVTVEPETSLHTVISSHNMGLIVEPENKLALKKGILDAVDEPHTDLKLHARRYAEDFLTIDNVINRYFTYVTQPRKKRVMKSAELVSPDAPPLWQVHSNVS